MQRRTFVVNVRNTKGTHYTYVGRGHPLGNPYKLNKKGTNRADVICQYFQHLIKDRSLQSLVAHLQGKTLGCWCYPLPCHGDVLAALADCFTTGKRVKVLESLPEMDLHHLSMNRPEGEFICYIGTGESKVWAGNEDVYIAITQAYEKWLKKGKNSEETLA